MRRIIDSTAEALLVRSFAFEPALRAQLRRDGTEAARIEDVLQEVYARLLTAVEAGRVRAHHLRTTLFDILADVLRTASPAPSPSGECPPQGSLAAELASEAGRSFTASMRKPRTRWSERRREVDAGRADLRRLLALAASFPTPQRRVFTLRKVYGLRPHQIAKALGLTEAEVERCLIAAALACARQCFDPNHGQT